MVAGGEILYGRQGRIIIKYIHKYELDLHFFGYQCLYVYSGVLSLPNTHTRFGKSRKIGHELHEYAVFLDRAYRSGNSFSAGEQSCIFSPCAEQFLMGEPDSAAVYTLDDSTDILSDIKPVGRVRYARYRYRIYRYQ